VLNTFLKGFKGINPLMTINFDEFLFCTSKIKGALVRDMKTGLPIKVHPTIKEMLPYGNNPYYLHNLTQKTGQYGTKLKNPETV